MDKQKAIEIISESDIIKKWHFFKYQFEFYDKGYEHILAKSIVDAVVDIEALIPEAGKDYIRKISSINDKPNDTKHYEQLLQILAELVIVHKAATFGWGSDSKFSYEPKIGSSNRNPELTITMDNLTIGIEVKTPELVAKHNERSTKETQLPSRSELVKGVDLQNTMLPRDNAIKDYLISADKKFEGFKQNDSNFYSILVIVWDDFIYEPISALTSPQAGLFTDNSFAKNANGDILNFPNIDSVIITRHLLPIYRGTRDEPLPDLSKHPLDYGRAGEFPFKIIFRNPWSKLEVPEVVIECFQVLDPGPELGAEYQPSDIIQWI